ncbi:(2Fe-2S) ferredoxin domain-containing protein [Prochlorothrix hollandica]|uniref:(2Fe-2S) ferredoxin domain-containing protein n=1 Tax=Prochlorothrix hollandica TaxID=1223 RepID=UPI001930A6FE|nr:(2Fe-2S) ferredoxin domain-containing protein [Prochlorothrix hollandica]
MPKPRCILVCQHRSCQRNGSEAVLEALAALGLPGVFASGTDCLGQCSSGPTVQVLPDRAWYCRVTVADVATIAQDHLLDDRPVQRLLHPRFHPVFDLPNPDRDPRNPQELGDPPPQIQSDPPAPDP